MASQLNPEASDSELLLVNPSFFPGGKISLRGAIENNRQEAVCTTLARLDSKADKDYSAFFSGGVLNDRLPPRMGYYLGYLVAREAGRTRTLKQLAQMKPTEIKPVVENALHVLAKCPPDGTVATTTAR